ncbi:unnamed protein product [Triticum turgidum subsp. durum]|uniref:Acidic protein n=1 Tax=Triticum turgidum subsp. durum TaxID=4567 RepID=A0A9R0XKX8_TRITD|nr:unnamed protein product [Triticum turgidum subsp. durum]
MYAMEGKGSLRAVILLLGAVLVVGSLVPLAEADPTAAATGAADAKFCCKDKIGSHCYAACTTQYGPTPFCAEMCCCVQLTSGRCPRQCPTPADPRLFLANSSTFDLLTTNAVEVESCTLRCSSIVCDSMRNVIDVGSVGTKAVVERCGDACGRFCAGAGGVASLDA